MTTDEMIRHAQRIGLSVLAISLGSLVWLSKAQCAEDDIMFAPKLFVDSNIVVGISGTLTGDGLILEKNTRSISCIKERKECLISSIAQVGVNAVGRLAFAYAIPIARWTDSEVVATDEPDDVSCVRTTIFLERKTQTALWVQEPINTARPECRTADSDVRHWTIEDPPQVWGRTHGK
jgi:hypothetical protein